MTRPAEALTGRQTLSADALRALKILLNKMDAAGFTQADRNNMRIRSAAAALLAANAPVAQPAGAVSAFPERDESNPAEQQGLFRKFDVRRVDGSDQPGGKHHGCRYFVLDMDHDAHAPGALRAYAESCRESHPQLSAELAAEFAAPTHRPKPAGAVPDLKRYRIDLPTGKDHEDPDGGYFRDTDVQQRIGYREAQVDDLSALVERLVRALHKANLGIDLPYQAMDYLRRHNLIDSPLRVAPSPEPATRADGGEPCQ